MLNKNLDINIKNFKNSLIQINKIIKILNPMPLKIIKSTRSSLCKIRPKLSICIPTWNRAINLIEQIENIKKSITDEIEIVIVDNNSTDQTYELIEKLIHSINFKIIYLRNIKNLGADVNYLRAIELASGEWCWLMGDDDPVDFGLISYLLLTIEKIKTEILLLIDEKDNINFDKYMPTLISGLSFFEPNHDVLGIQLQKVGRVLCKTDPAHEILQHAYNVGVGDLHSYLHIYADLLLKTGISVTLVDLILDTKPLSSLPRWNIIRGHTGAWKATVTAFSKYKIQAINRERRIRSNLLLIAVAGALNENMKVNKEDIIWMFKSFNIKFKIYLLLILILFKYLGIFRYGIISIFKPRLISHLYTFQTNDDVGY